MWGSGQKTGRIQRNKFRMTKERTNQKKEQKIQGKKNGRNQRTEDTRN